MEFQIIWDRENTSEWNDYLEEVRLVYQQYHRRWLENRVYTCLAASLVYYSIFPFFLYISSESDDVSANI